MKRLILLFLALVSYLAAANGQQSTDSLGSEKKMMRGEIEHYKALFKAQGTASSEERIDVTYYKLDITVTASPQYIKGSVTMNALCRVSSLSWIRLDMTGYYMTMDSVKVNGIPAVFTQSVMTFDVTLDHTYGLGEPMTVVMYYRGSPGYVLGSFTFSSHAGTPWIWSLSEPFGAKDWWPCKDHPGDKADSIDVYVTVNSAYKVGSEGKLVSVTAHKIEGTSTYHWHHHYPISTYLVSVAITNYASFTNYFRYSPTDSMPVLNYILPEDLSTGQANLPRTIGMLDIYSRLFGLYPYIDEKYGHSEFGWGGGMEHQTMTSLGPISDEYVTAHECAHQWFGDMITCKTWPDIWINEGFAEYCTGLYYENRYGKVNYRTYMAARMSSAKLAYGTVYVADSVNLFDGSLVYNKGATVLHMLRRVLGDSGFFHSMWAYANDPALKFGNASTHDFQAVCETVTGRNLGFFFNEWIYGEKYPRYFYTWTAVPSGGGFRVNFSVSQTTGTTNPAFFTMPIDLKVSAPGWDTTVVVWNDSASQVFSFDVSHMPVEVKLDPDDWILKDFVSSLEADRGTMIMLPSIEVGTSKTDSLSLRNRSGVSITILSEESTIPDITVSPDTVTIPPGGDRKFHVTYIPQTPGGQAGYLRFIYSGSGSPVVVYLIVGAFNPPAFDYALPSGWTLLSLPMNVRNPRASALFPSGVGGPYRFTADSGYQPQDSLEGGIGYWMKFPSSGSVRIYGQPVETDTFQVIGGWNLIGSIHTPLLAAAIRSEPPGIIVSPFYGYKGGYRIADTINPGYAYWVKTGDSGVLMVDASVSFGKGASVGDHFSKLGRLIITDARGSSQTLYFGNKQAYVQAALGEMPPLPPEGVFDARFQNGTFVEFSDGSSSRDLDLAISSPVYPLTVGWEAGVYNCKASLVAGDRLIPLSGSGSTVITDPRVTIRLRLGPDDTHVLPSEFALRQNYPNPFNPGTTISFDVPRKSFIGLRVFNTLGEEIAILVNEVLDAGTYEVQFDASKLASGMYFYDLRSGDFHSTKKLVLMR